MSLVSLYSKSISWCRVHRLVIFMGVLTLLSAPVRAENHLRNAVTIADVRCVVVGMKLAEMADASQRSAGMMFTLYYIGRLEGRNSKLDLESLLLNNIETLSSSEYESEAKRCGTGLAEKGRQITKIGKDLIERAPRLSEKPATPTQ